jgi:hypothetical protein
MPSPVSHQPHLTHPNWTRCLRGFFPLFIGGLLAGCSASESIVSNSDSGTNHADTASATGGAATTGGGTGSAGANGGTVSVPASSTVGSANSGTTSATATSGGATASGGTSVPGSIPSSGGSPTLDAGPGSGGTSGTAGISGTAGLTETGGTSATGGSPTIDAGTGSPDTAGGGKMDASAGNSGGAGNTTTGGTGKTGGTTATGGGSATGGATSSAGCTAVPVTPNATQQTRNALCYLYGQYGNHIISGQEENATGQPSGNDVEFNYIYATTGKYPAIRAFDVNNADNDVRCLAQWNANGLCMFGYHMGVANGMPDGYDSAKTKVDINTVLTEGSDLNTTFKSRMDKAAAEMQKVQDGNGVVIWRPFHEAGGAWFWWSMGTGAQYVSLWKYMFNYMTATKGLRNLIWLLPYDGSPNASFYPGPQYVDIGGADNYDKAFDYSPMTSIYTAAKGVFGNTMPIALHECGPFVDPDQLQSTKTNWLFFSIWTEPYPSTTWNSTDELKKVYSSSYVVTRDEMPSLK